MIWCMCLNSNIGRNVFTVFYREGIGQRMFNAEMTQRDKGTFSKTMIDIVDNAFLCQTLIYATAKSSLRAVMTI